MEYFSCFSKTPEQRAADFNARAEELNRRISGDNKGIYAINYTDQSTRKQKTISLSAFIKKVVEINEEFSKIPDQSGYNQAKLQALNAALASRIASCKTEGAAGSVDQKRKAASSGRGFLSNFFKLFSRDYWFCDTRYEKFYNFYKVTPSSNPSNSKIAETFKDQFRDTSDPILTVSDSSPRSNSIELSTQGFSNQGFSTHEEIRRVASNSFSNDGSSNIDNASVKSSLSSNEGEIMDVLDVLQDDH